MFTSLDSVAKAPVMRFKGFNTTSPEGGGCPVCCHPGERVRHCFAFWHFGQVGSRTLYCWQHLPSKLRDTQSIIEYLKEPNPSPVQPTIKGRTLVRILTIIGPSILLELPYYDLIGDTVIDSMHACWEGVTKQFLRLWFDTSNKEMPYYIVPAKKTVFESRLKNIKFPHDFSHPVRSYEKDGAFWKGFLPGLVFVTASFSRRIEELCFNYISQHNVWVFRFCALWAFHAVLPGNGKAI